MVTMRPVHAQDALWRSYYTAAQGAYQKGAYPESESLLKTALDASIKSDESLSTYYYLAHVYVKSQNYPKAEECYKTVLDNLGTKVWGVLRPPDGTPEWEQNPDKIEIASDNKRFLSVLNKRPPQLISVQLAKPITIIDVLGDYGTLMQIQNRYLEAETSYRQALTLIDCRPDLAGTYEMRILQRLASLYQAQGRTAEEKSVAHQLLVARNDSIPDFDELVAKTIKNLDHFAHNPDSLAIRLNNLAIFCSTHGDYGRAQSLFNRALSCLEQSPARHKKDRAVILRNYSDLLLAMGRVSEATNLSKEAVGLGSDTPLDAGAADLAIDKEVPPAQ
jgi:tetratricopeptide (TPR) repeat protein